MLFRANLYMLDHPRILAGKVRTTNILPGQFLGPTEKGCTTSLLSSLYFGSPSHRSGIKENGSKKFLVEVFEQ